MKNIRLDELDILKVGNAIGMAGTVWTGEGKTYLCMFPDGDIEKEMVLLEMGLSEWEKFIRQSDLLETEILEQDPQGIKKAIIRKSQRQIDTRLQWRVFERDNYKCRYCGRTGIPLTVDHLIIWEEGGPTVEKNLLSACRKCNKTRGSKEYGEWINSPKYLEKAGGLTEEEREKNIAKIRELQYIKKVKNIRSR